MQIILQTSGESVKEDMALLAWCGSENGNARSEEIRMALISAAWLVLIYGLSLAMSECHDVIAYDGPRRLFLASTFSF